MICCVTGHRPSGFNFPREATCPLYTEYLKQLSNLIEELILSNHSEFITGMADGADIDFAMEVLNLKKRYSHITLEAAIPCPLYKAHNRTIYHETRDFVIDSCDIKNILSDHHYHRGCMDKRNRYMVDKSDLIIAIWNGSQHGGTWNTIQYAKKKNKKIIYLMLNELQISDIKQNR